MKPALLALLLAALPAVAGQRALILEREVYTAPGWATGSAAGHEKAWWQAIITNDFEPHADAPAVGLLPELSSYLGSPDPELRDEIGYAVLTQWIYVKQLVPADVLQGLVAEWRANLSRGIGAQGTDTVFLRSFSALMLSVAAALDNKSPWLDKAGFDGLLADALVYLREERDTRGFDEEKGWIHSVAHTADLLKFLARSRFLEAADQGAILSAIADKLDATDHVLVRGEDERLARAVASIVARPDADMGAFERFLERLRPTPTAGLPTRPALAVNQNRKNLAVSLHALLATDASRAGSTKTAREKLLKLLEEVL